MLHTHGFSWATVGVSKVADSWGLQIWILNKQSPTKSAKDGGHSLKGFLLPFEISATGRVDIVHK